MPNLNFKNIFLSSLVLVGLILFFIPAVKALTVEEARTNYENAVKPAKDGYIAKVNAAIQKEVNDLQVASDAFQQRQITQDEYNAKIAEINNAFNKTLSDASASLRKDIENARKVYMESMPIPVIPTAKYKCSGSSCVRDDVNGTYTDPNCNGVCAAPTAKYKCSGSSCVRDDANGTYTDSSCGGACVAPTAKYKCSGSSCVRDDANGTYTNSSCNNSCVSSATMTPASFSQRYGVACGIKSGESIKAGETKYYKIDMTKWIEWQRQYFSVYKSVNIERQYSSCISNGAAALANYNAICDSATGEPNSAWCAANPSECFAANWLGTCHTAPDANYAQTCASNRTRDKADADSKLKTAEDLYKTGNYVTVFLPEGSSCLALGCDHYASAWGCNDIIGDSKIQYAIGYNQPPLYEKYTTFSDWGCLAISSVSPISASNPLSEALQGILQTTGQGPGGCISGGINSGEAILFFKFDADIGASGANEIFLMIHNAGPTNRNSIIEFGCPTAMSQADYDAYIKAKQANSCATSAECDQKLGKKLCKCIRQQCSCPNL